LTIRPFRICIRSACSSFFSRRRNANSERKVTISGFGFSKKGNRRFDGAAADRIRRRLQPPASALRPTVSKWDFDRVPARAASVFDVPVPDVLRSGHRRPLALARSLACYRAVREPGLPSAELARRLP
jgi:hypothetical protein